MMGVWQADMSGLSGKSKSARIVAEPAPVRDPMLGKSSLRPDSMDDAGLCVEVDTLMTRDNHAGTPPSGAHPRHLRASRLAARSPCWTRYPPGRPTGWEQGWS